MSKQTIRLRTIIDNRFAAAFTRLTQERMMPKDAFILARVARDIQNAVNDYTNTRNTTIKQNGYQPLDERVEVAGKPNPNLGKPTSTWRVQPHLADKVQADLEALLEQPVGIRLTSKIELPASVGISASDLALLEDLVDLPEPLQKITAVKTMAEIEAEPTADKKPD